MTTTPTPSDASPSASALGPSPGYWLRYSATVPATSCETVESLLVEHGAVAVTVQAANDEELFAEHGADTPLWQRCRVDGLFEEAPDWQCLESTLMQREPSAECEPPQVLANTDWSQSFRQFAVERVFNKRLRLASRDAQELDGLLTVRLDPGLAFGSGSHPTTRLCLAWLAKQDLAGMDVLDFGCGSGVLAIAMAKLGARRVVGVDIDPQALLATRENAEHNGLGTDLLSVVDTVRFSIPEGGFQLVVANILLRPLMELAPLLVAALAPGGCLVVSGILTSQQTALQDAYPGIAFHDLERDEDWLVLTGRHR